MNSTETIKPATTSKASIELTKYPSGHPKIVVTIGNTRTVATAFTRQIDKSQVAIKNHPQDMYDILVQSGVINPSLYTLVQGSLRLPVCHVNPTLLKSA